MSSSGLQFLFDSDLKLVGSWIARAREDAWVLGQDPCPIAEGPDEVWFPRAGAQKLVVIRRDADILNIHTAERRYWEDNNCRGFVLTIEKPTVWDELKAIVQAWDNMRNYAGDRPRDRWWVARVLRNGRIRPE